MEQQTKREGGGRERERERGKGQTFGTDVARSKDSCTYSYMLLKKPEEWLLCAARARVDRYLGWWIRGAFG
jgi:hypothetical protein